MFQFPGRQVVPQPTVGTTLASPVAAPVIPQLQHNAVMPVTVPQSPAPQNPNLQGLMAIMAHLGASSRGMPTPNRQNFMTNHPQFVARHPNFARWPGTR